MLGCTRFGVGAWNPSPPAQVYGLTLSHCTAWSHTLLLPCFTYCTTQEITGGCELKENASCMQNQGGKGGTRWEIACGNRTVWLQIDCILPLRTSSLHWLRYDIKERYFNLRSSLSEGKNLGFCAWCSEVHGQTCQLEMCFKCLKWGLRLLSSGKFKIQCPKEISGFYIHCLGFQAIKVR